MVQNVLRTCPTLSVLKLGYNSLGDAGCITICQDIRMHPSLTVFDVGFNSIGDKGCEAVARALKGNSVLTKLYLSGNSFGYVGCSALAEAVEHGCGLISLHLTANKAGSRGISQLMNATTLNQRKVHERQVAELQTKEKFSRSERSATEVANDLLANIGVPACKELASEPESSRGELLPICNLQEMFFGGTAMKSGGCLSVSNMLLTNLSLRVLSLSDNGLTDDDIALLSQSLSRNKSLPLEKLQLSFNQISCVGVEALMNAVWGSQTLTEVKLDNNQIRDRGAQLAAVVLTSVDLQVLDMGFNRITTVGVKALMKALAENTCVVALTLSGNALDTNSAKGVSYALAFNKNLKEFYMDHCSLGHAAQRHIAAGIVSNSNIVLKRLTGFPLGGA